MARCLAQMASQVEPWIVNKLLSLNRVHDAQHDGEYCQILKVSPAGDYQRDLLTDSHGEVVPEKRSP